MVCVDRSAATQLIKGVDGDPQRGAPPTHVQSTAQESGNLGDQDGEPPTRPIAATMSASSLFNNLFIDGRGDETVLEDPLEREVLRRHLEGTG